MYDSLNDSFNNKQNGRNLQEVHPRTIKSYVIRAGRMTSAQKKNYALLSEKWCVPYQNKVINFEKLFGNKNPVTAEIGFGMGAATVEIALANPEKNYIGIEVHRPGIGKLLGELEARNLTNVRIIACDALSALEDMFADGSLSAFHVFFPDPWPKKRHHKRRLVQRPNTALFASKLAADGYFYMATDWRDYAESALSELSATEGFVNRYDGFAERQIWRPLTKFEKRGVEEARDIYELYFVKK